MRLYRLRLAEFAYLRGSKSGGEQHEERTVVFVVDAAEVAAPNEDARKALADATGAAHAEIEAKKVTLLWPLQCDHLLPLDDIRNYISVSYELL